MKRARSKKRCTDERKSRMNQERRRREMTGERFRRKDEILVPMRSYGGRETVTLSTLIHPKELQEISYLDISIFNG